MTTSLHLQLLGGFHLDYNHQPITLANAPRLQSLLAYLALNPDVPRRRQQLAFLLWPDSSEKRAQTSLRKQLYRLRQTFPEAEAFIKIDNHTICWSDGVSFRLDVADFEAAVAEATEQTGGQVARTRLEQAINLYRGDLLPNCYDDWIIPERERLSQRFIEALAGLIQVLEHQGDYATAIHYAQRLIQHDPLREAAYQQLMHLYALTGNRAGALHTYQTWAGVLQQELGIEPGPAIRDLYERLLDVDSPGLRTHNLPAPPTAFIGRDKELSEVIQRLTNPACRLLTLVGPGGVGKTRLALQAGRQLVDTESFAGGVFFVSLASISSGRIDHLISAIIEALGLFFYSPESPKTQLFNHLREKEMLLILDNFEHLLPSSDPDPLDAGPHSALDFVAEILQSAAELKVMVTSRERLSLYGEWLFPLYGLEFPDSLPPVEKTLTPFEVLNTQPDIEQYSATQLLLQSAQRANAGFVLTEAEKPYLVRLCQLVEGLPLGLELAATWAGALSFREIVGKMEQSLSFLTTSLRNVPERHRSLRLSIEHAWQLLTPEEQRAFRNLSVFRGGLRPDAAEAVATVPLSILLNLVHKSLLRRTASGRYELHELLRQYAAEQLQALPDELARMQHRHSDYYAAFVFEHMADLKGSPRQQQVSAEISEEIENVRLAWQWALDHQRGQALYHLVCSLVIFYEWRGWFQECELMVQQVLRVLPEIPLPSPLKEAILGHTLGHHGFALCRNGQFEQAVTTIQQSLDLFQTIDPDHPEAASHVHFYLGIAILGQGKLEQAIQQLEKGLALSRQAGDLWGAAGSLTYLGHAARRQGDLDRARQYYQESIAVSKRAGDRKGLAIGLNELGAMSLEAGQPQQARHYCRESLAIFREIADQPGLVAALDNLGQIALNLDEPPAALRYFREALEIGLKIRFAPAVLKTLASLALLLSRPRREAQLLAVELLTFVMRHPLTDNLTQARADQHLAELTPQLSPNNVIAAQVRSETRTLDDIVAVVLQHTG